MEELKFKILSDKIDVNHYLDKVEYYLGVRLPKAYVAKSKIVGVYVSDRLVAGYMLVTKPGFRSLMFVPDQIKEKSPFFNKDAYEMMEVNGLWIGPSVKSPRAQFRIWRHLLWNIFACRKKYLLLMSDEKNKTIKRIHELTNPKTLYEGVSASFAGESTHKRIRVAYTTRWKALYNFPRYLMELRIRESRRRFKEESSVFNKTQLVD